MFIFRASKLSIKNRDLQGNRRKNFKRLRNRWQMLWREWSMAIF